MSKSLFRYMPSEYSDALVRLGEIRFKSLSYYRDYEDNGIRGDEFEGTRLHLPIDGLKVTKVTTGEVIPLPCTFESTVREDDIFVSCLSTTYSQALAEEFEADTCVEIFEPARFLGHIRNALNRRPSIKNKHLEHGLVRYYQAYEPPIVDWALPERIALTKLSKFAYQKEYRLAFAINGAFNVQNVEVKLKSLGERRILRSTDHPNRLFKLGNMSKLCKIHYF